MKFLSTIHTDLTWFCVEGTEEELLRCRDWIDQNKTHRVVIDTWVRPDINPGSFAARFKAIRDGTDLLEQNFGFESKDDAMRFKLAMA